MKLKITLVENPEFKTHLNYVSNLAYISKNIDSVYKNKIQVNTNLDKYKTKENLFKLTAKSIMDEKQIVSLDSSYSKAVCAWIPVKSYYLCYNLMLTILYLITGDEKDFQKGHTQVIDIFNDKLFKGEIEFSQPLFNIVFDRSVLTFKAKSGFNISMPKSKKDRETLYRLSIGKIAKYKRDEYKRKNKLNIKKSHDKLQLENYLDKKFKVSIFDFLYQMRIRSNYRDLHFIELINDFESKDYFNCYCDFLDSFIKALFKMYSDIKKKRGLN